MTKIDIATVDQSLIGNLLAISKTVRAFMSIRLAELQLRKGGDEVLMALEENVVMTVSALASRLHVRPDAVSRMIEPLVPKGYLTRTGDRRDSRRTLVELTPLGIEVRAKVIELWAQIDYELAAGMSQAQQQDVRTSIASLKKLMDDRLHPLR